MAGHIIDVLIQPEYRIHVPPVLHRIFELLALAIWVLEVADEVDSVQFSLLVVNIRHEGVAFGDLFGNQTALPAKFVVIFN